MKAIDLYSGVGGWSLGLGMAGVEVIRSYEWWAPANLTNSLNSRHETVTGDIRQIPLSSFPSADIVVGSPPCTHFSLANRGGRGNIMEGLKDVEKFLEVVAHLKPRFWAMENVPRLASILKKEFDQGGLLHRFSSLNPEMFVVDASEWGVPQKRQRLIFGNLDFARLLSYRKSCPCRTLGHVLSRLSSSPPRDPVYDMGVVSVSDNEIEQNLSPEEERINREVKTHHPIYNNMSFPDSESRPSRTVTATCTRVSRESIIVASGEGFRRLTLRERASIQSFPVNYEFYGSTHSQKQKMIGNALPPLLAYHIAHAMMGTDPSDLPPASKAISYFKPPSEVAKITPPDKPGLAFPLGRKFRFAIPNLRFKSGVRFELSNHGGEWRTRFFYGDSKNTKELILGPELIREALLVDGVKKCLLKARKFLVEVGGILGVDPEGLQMAWNHSGEGHPPFPFLDSIGIAANLSMNYNPDDLALSVVSGIMTARHNPKGFEKLKRNAPGMFAGILVCSSVNEMLSGRLFSLEKADAT